jgi:UDP-N-acetylmuramate dehydrogenase
MSYISELNEICSKLNCTVSENEPLKNHVSFRIGGLCRALVSVNGTECIAEIMDFCKRNNIKYTVLGKGSNVLVSDNGFNGIVMLMGKDFADVSVSGNTIKCSAGASLKSLCMNALENNLSGAEFAYGIPGTVGGAVFMNAGAYGGEIKDIIVSADYIDDSGIIKTVSKDEMDLSYRHSIFSDNPYIITGAEFCLEKGNYDEIKVRMNELMEKRKDKQPLEYPSAGSTFKRPQGAYAAALIEQCGLKGVSVGDAEVSVKHSGFIVNKGSATFEDVMTLVDKVQKKVKEKTGYTLEMEPEIIE